MRKKLLSLLLVLCMVLALAPAALADNAVLGAAPGDDTGVRETDFLDQQTHADVDYADMKVVEVTEEQFLAAIDETKALIAANAADETVLDAFHKVTGLLDTISCNLTLLNIRNSADVNDAASKDAYKLYEKLYNKIINPFMFLVQDMLKSNCRDYFIKTDRLTEDDVTYYENFEEVPEEEFELNEKITEYQQAYSTAAGAGDLDTMYDMFIAVRDANIESLKFQDTYDSYAELAYAEIFGRDYTVEEAEAFFEAVKTYIVPLALDYYEVIEIEQAGNNKDIQDILVNDYTTDETLTLIRPYLGRMSGELLEAWDYMIGHHLYDIGFTEAVKDGRGFTTRIDGYGAPFFFNTPTGTLYDFTTIIHEFGHYNNFFSHPNDWNEGACSFDVAEVHSQGLEVLFTQFYDDIFGEYDYIAEDYVLDNILMAILQGCEIAELELYAYSSTDVTVDMIEEKYEELWSDYGFSFGDWIEIPHLTIQPLYYISYATSAIGALSFWNEAQAQGFDAATDLYLEFVSQPYYAEFQEEFEEILGVDPMNADYIAEIADTLYENLDVEEKLSTLSVFPDVPSSDPNLRIFNSLYLNGIINGGEGGLFRPDDYATRAEVAQSIYNFLMLFFDDEDVTGEFTDVSGKWYEHAVNFCAALGLVNGYVNEKGELVFDGDALITRQELCVIFYRLLSGLLGPVDTTPSPELTDTASAWAVDGMNALVNVGWLNPATDAKRFESRDTLAVFLYRTLYELSTAQ